MEFLSNKVGSYQDSLKSSLLQVWNFFFSFFQNENIGNHLNNQNNSPEPLREDEVCTIVDRIMLDEPGNDTEEGSNDTKLATRILPCNVITSEGHTEIWAAVLTFVANAISKGRGSTSVILTQLNKRAVKWRCLVSLIFWLVLQSNIAAAEQSEAMHSTFTSNHCNCSGFEDMCPLPHDCCNAGPSMHTMEVVYSESHLENIFSSLVSGAVLAVIACATFSCCIGWNNRPENNQEAGHPTQEAQVTIIPPTTAEEQRHQNAYTSVVESREEEAIPQDGVLIFSTEKLGKLKDLIKSEAATAACFEEEPDDARRRYQYSQEEDSDPKPSRETGEGMEGSSAVVVHKPHLSNIPLSDSKFVFIPPAYSLMAPTVLPPLPPPSPPPPPPPRSAKGGIEIAKMGEEGFFGYHCLMESEVAGELQPMPLHGNEDIFLFIAQYGE